MHEINGTFVSFGLISYYISFVIIKYYIINCDASVTRENIDFLITHEIKYDITLKDTNILYVFVQYINFYFFICFRILLYNKSI